MQLNLGRISFTLLTGGNVSGGDYRHGRVHVYRYMCMSGFPFRISIFLDRLYIYTWSLFESCFYVFDFTTYTYR